MSRTVHLLKFWNENSEFLEHLGDKKKCVVLLKECGNGELAETMCKYNMDLYQVILHKGKAYDIHLKGLIDKFNEDNKITNKRDLYKGLTLPRLSILVALLAQKKHLRTRPAYSADLILSDTPDRFKTKFRGLMVKGMWLLGSVIEDSLSNDPDVNCGNPFGFVPGDLGYWWAAVVMLDWVKSVKTLLNEKSCVEFYKDPNLKRSSCYHQHSSLSHLERIPVQFLEGENLVNFSATIKSVSSRQYNVLKFKRKTEGLVLTFDMSLLTKNYKALKV